MVAVSRHFIGVGVDDRELFLALSRVVEVDTNTTRNNVVVVSLEDIGWFIAAIGTESIVVARVDLAAERDLVQAQVTVNGVAAQVTALSPERVSQVDSGLWTQICNGELAAGNAISVVGVGCSAATAECASRDVGACRERVAFTTSTLQKGQ